jgi:hypothetical protein
MMLGVGGTFVVVPKLSVSRFWGIMLALRVTHLSSNFSRSRQARQKTGLTAPSRQSP